MPPKKKRKISPYFSSSSSSKKTNDEEEVSLDDSNNNVKKNSDNKDPCAICLDEIKDSASIACVHHFCFECIKQWANVTNLCPLCKVPFSSITKKNNNDLTNNNSKSNNNVVVIVEDKQQTAGNEEDDEEYARQLQNGEGNLQAHFLEERQHGYDSDNGFVVPDDVIDYVEYDDGLPNTEEDSYINDDESFTEDSESLDFTPIARRLPRRNLRRSTLISSSRSQGRRISSLREINRRRRSEEESRQRNNNTSVINLVSNENNDNNNNNVVNLLNTSSDGSVVDLISPEQNIDNDDTNSENSDMVFSNFHRRENNMNTPIVIHTIGNNNNDDDDEIEESPYF